MHGLLITDPTCHLPDGFLARYHIERLTQTDTFAERLLEDWLYHCDALLAVGSQIEISHWQELVGVQQSQFEQRRLAAHLQRSFQLRLYASDQHCAALGIIVSEAARLLELGWSIDAVRAQLVTVESEVEHYLAAPAGSVWSRASLPFYQPWRRNSASVVHVKKGRMQCRAFSTGPINALFELANNGAPETALFNLSYAGELASLHTMAGFKEWHQRIIKHGSQCWLSRMDAVSAQQYGPGALSLAWLSAPACRETP